ncbi:MAG TPA: FHA domain-containing protein, partial [Phycisphaerae bacterium]
MPSIRYLDDAGQSQTLALGGEPVLIGRVATCQIAISDDLISREHARIERTADQRYHLRDLGSRNKTFVNGQTISEVLLSSGDIIRIGDRVLEFLEDGVARDKLDLEFLTPDRSDPVGSEWIKFKTPVTLTLSQLESLSRLGSNLGATARPEDIANSALSQLIVDLQAERGFVAMRGENKKEIHPIAQRGLVRSPGTSLTPVSQTFVYAAILQQVSGRYPQHPDDLQTKAGY